jgi:RNA polymerase primary sigma factor
MKKFRDASRIVRAYLSVLPENYQTVIKLRYGLHDGKEWKLEEAAKFLGCSAENVRQIQEKAEAILSELENNLTSEQ